MREYSVLHQPTAPAEIMPFKTALAPLLQPIEFAMLRDTPTVSAVGVFDPADGRVRIVGFADTRLSAYKVLITGNVDPSLNPGRRDPRRHLANTLGETLTFGPEELVETTIEIEVMEHDFTPEIVPIFLYVRDELEP